MGQNGSRPPDGREWSTAAPYAESHLPGCTAGGRPAHASDTQHGRAGDDTGRSPGLSPHELLFARSEKPRWPHAPVCTGGASGCGAGDCAGPAMLEPGQYPLQSRSGVPVQREAVSGHSNAGAPDASRPWSGLPVDRVDPGPAGAPAERPSARLGPAAAAVKRDAPGGGGPRECGSEGARAEPKRLRPGSGPSPTTADPACDAGAQGEILPAVARPPPTDAALPFCSTSDLAHPRAAAAAASQATAAAPNANCDEPGRNYRLVVAVPVRAADEQAEPSAVMEEEISPRAAAAADAMIGMNCTPLLAPMGGPSASPSLDGSPMSLSAAGALHGSPASSADHACHLPRPVPLLPHITRNAYRSGTADFTAARYPVPSMFWSAQPIDRPHPAHCLWPARSDPPLSTAHHFPAVTERSILVCQDGSFLAGHQSELAQYQAEMSSSRGCFASHPQGQPHPRASIPRCVAQAHPYIGDTGPGAGSPPALLPSPPLLYPGADASTASLPPAPARTPGAAGWCAPGPLTVSLPPPPHVHACASAIPFGSGSQARELPPYACDGHPVPAALALAPVPVASPLPPAEWTAPPRVATSRKEGVQRAVWTMEDDALIFQAIARYGCKWRQIAQLFPGRTDDAIRNRWHRLEMISLQQAKNREQGVASSGSAAESAHVDVGGGVEESAPSASPERAGAMELGQGAPAGRTPECRQQPVAYKCSRCGLPKKMHVCMVASANPNATLEDLLRQQRQRWFDANKGPQVAADQAPADAGAPTGLHAAPVRSESGRACASGAGAAAAAAAPASDAAPAAAVGGIAAAGAPDEARPPTARVALLAGTSCHAPVPVACTAASVTQRSLPIESPAELAEESAEGSPPSPADQPACSEEKPSRIGSSWTAREDEAILAGVKRFGCKWARIAALLPGRTSQATRNRHHRMLHQQERQPDPSLLAEMRAMWAADALPQPVQARGPDPAVPLPPTVHFASGGAGVVPIGGGCGGGCAGDVVQRMGMCSHGGPTAAYACHAAGASYAYGFADPRPQAWAPHDWTTLLPEVYSGHPACLHPHPLGAGLPGYSHQCTPAAHAWGGAMPPGDVHELGWAGMLEMARPGWPAEGSAAWLTPPLLGAAPATDDRCSKSYECA